MEEFIWLLEINTSPSLNIYFETARNFMERVEMQEEDICQVNLYVKSRVVTDTIHLANSENLSEIEEFRSLQRIHPGNDSAFYNLVTALRAIFLRLTPSKTNASITDQNFQKLYTTSFIKKKLASQGF